MKDKLFVNPQMLADHEIIEILLYFSIPRKDTNEQAHKLIRMLGGLEGIKNASVDEIMGASGIGRNSALHLKAVSEFARRATEQKKKKIKLDNPEKVSKQLAFYLDGKECEHGVILFLDRDYYQLGLLEFAQKDKYSVGIDLAEVAKAIAIHNPTFVILAHNHTSESCKPGVQDVLTTEKIKNLCEVHGANVIDHIIVNRDDSFSFRRNGIMDMIKSGCDAKEIINSLKEET